MGAAGPVRVGGFAGRRGSGRCGLRAGPDHGRCCRAARPGVPCRPGAAAAAAVRGSAAAARRRPPRTPRSPTPRRPPRSRTKWPGPASISELVRAATPIRASGTSKQIPDLRAAVASVRAGVPAGPAAALGGGRPGGDVSGEVSQVRIGPRGERQADPRVQFVPGQPVLYERDLEQLDHPLAIRTGHPQAAAAPGSCCPLVSRPCHHRRLLPARRGTSVTRLHPPGPSCRLAMIERERHTDRKRGGQPGHQGTGLQRDPDPDARKDAGPPAQCRTCQARLDGAEVAA